MSPPDARLRVLFVGAFPPPGRKIYGGIVSSCAALLATDLSRRVHFLLVDSTQISNPPPSLLTRLRFASGRFLRFCLCVSCKRPDLVLIFVSSGASIAEKGAMAWVARMFGIPVLLFPRAGRVIEAARKSAAIRIALRVSFRPASILLCQSDVWRKFACAQLGMSVDRTWIIENWTASAELLAIGAARAETAAETRVCRLIFVGWVEREKGILDLLEACGDLPHSSRFSLQIVGDGTARVDAEALAEKKGIASHVSFRGWLSSAALYTVLAESDIFVLPSWAEGLPNAMIEAMAAGIPIVASRVGGIPDVIQHGTNGLLVEPRSPESICESLRDLIDRKDLRLSLGRAGHDLAKRRFSGSAAAERFQKAFDAAVRR